MKSRKSGGMAARVRSKPHPLNSSIADASIHQELCARGAIDRMKSSFQVFTIELLVEYF